MPNHPPPQQNLQRAIHLAWEALRGRTVEPLQRLGAEPTPTGLRLRVLDDEFLADVDNMRLTTASGREPGPFWTILVLHYLAVTTPSGPSAPEITFAQLPASRQYAGVYQQRTIGRLCATAGRTQERLHAAAMAVGGQPVEGGDAAYDFDLFPHVRLRLIWYGGDEDLGPSATLLLPANIEDYFCAEDIVVLSERLVARLAASPPKT